MGNFFGRSFFKIALLIVISLIATRPSLAEQCWQMDTCLNHIGLLRINKDGQAGEAIKILFGTDQVPSPGKIVTIHRPANLRSSFISTFDDRDLSLKDDVEFGGHEGDFMAAGTRVEILGYQVGRHLFVVVRIVQFSSEPYGDTPHYKYNVNWII
jgi:hypothetical protein